jgi:hypothetical protein
MTETLSASPLDYVPLSRLANPTNHKPTTFKPPALARAIKAAGVVLLFGLVSLAPAATLGVLAMCGAVWFGGKMATRGDLADTDQPPFDWRLVIAFAALLVVLALVFHN